MNKFTIPVLLYGFARKLHQLHGDPKVSSLTYDADKQRKCIKEESLYTTTKAFLTVTGGFASVYLWPYYLGKDVYAFEAHCRGHTLKAPDNLFDYIIA